MSAAENSSPITVLVVDDEEPFALICKKILVSEGYEVLCEGRGRTALEVVRRSRPAIVLVDRMLPDTDGLTLLKEIKQIAAETLVVMITGFATVDSSVEALQAGAYDYIPKPFTATQLRILTGRAAQQVRLSRDNERLRRELEQQNSFENIIGTSDAMQRIFSIVARVASTDASVFVAGESGTGKELIARAIHGRSRRSKGPFVAINCAALPPQLLESELFGHEKGAFTGADSRHRGLLEVASGGTFFLDEISEMSMELQAKLLRVVQERKIRRVGGDAELPIDVRWISATNRDPEEAVDEGMLRRDLFFRLNVVPLGLPPLRQRREDIPLLATHFLRQFCRQYGRNALRLSPAALRILSQHSWPGNVRELQNVMERLVSLSASEEIDLDDLPDDVTSTGPWENGAAVSFATDLPFHDAKAEAISAFEQTYLRSLLARTSGNISRAARQAGIDRKTIHRMLSKYDIENGN